MVLLRLLYSSSKATVNYSDEITCLKVHLFSAMRSPSHDFSLGHSIVKHLVRFCRELNGEAPRRETASLWWKMDEIYSEQNSPVYPGPPVSDTFVEWTERREAQVGWGREENEKREAKKRDRTEACATSGLARDRKRCHDKFGSFRAQSMEPSNSNGWLCDPILKGRKKKHSVTKIVSKIACRIILGATVSQFRMQYEYRMDFPGPRILVCESVRVLCDFVWS